MKPQQFIAKWKAVSLSERAAAQSHFIDVCHLVGHKTPVEYDPTGEKFTFEKGLRKVGGGRGFADVWKRRHFAWEYKKDLANMDLVLRQLSQYALALESPPLHIACDTLEFRIVTAWTNTVPDTHTINLAELEDPDKLNLLRWAFHDPNKLNKGARRADLTKEAADKFSTLATRLHGRGHAAAEVAQFVNRLAFLFFAEDVRLLEENYFRGTLAGLIGRAGEAQNLFNQMFQVMQRGGWFGRDRLPWINGGLFAANGALPLDDEDLMILVEAGRVSWAHIDPSIFGTLFERFLDPSKRAQIGAHYTDAEKIYNIVEPVVMRPLKKAWARALNDISAIMTPVLTADRNETGRGAEQKRARSFEKASAKASAVRNRFLDRLMNVRILDPACGSANFLYVALQCVRDLELQVNQECEQLGLHAASLHVSPQILQGIELNPVAAELARTTVWIGDIQWEIRNSYLSEKNPVLEDIKTIECRNALINADDTEASWPPADFIVGNPPFLGGKMLRRNLGDASVDALFKTYGGRVPAEADLVAYWFEKARAQIARGEARRAGLVTTNSIRGGANRRVLERIAADMPIFSARSDEAWVVDGAAVRVSLVCFGEVDAGEAIELDGEPVERINPDLTGVGNGADLTGVRRLAENRGVAFMGNTKGGAFDVPGDVARAWLTAPVNVNGRPNADVLRPWINGLDIARRPRDMWIIDFNAMGSDNEAAFYEAPFAHILAQVRPERLKNRREAYARNWWRHVEARPRMSQALAGLPRHLVTPRVARHRLFSWSHRQTVPDCRLFAFARSDDYFFGMLQSRFHEIWSLKTCSWHGVGNDPTYNSETCFETFPFPAGLTSDRPVAAVQADPRGARIECAAQRLEALRRAWLNPADLVTAEPEVVPGYPDRFVPKTAAAAIKLKDRTLTNLYNARPRWLDDARAELDRAVAAAYGWPEDIATDDALARLVALNGQRGAA